MTDIIYDPTRWELLREDIPLKTLQVFITNRCNLRCDGCFYMSGLSNNEMSFTEYTDLINKSLLNDRIQKVVLMGGEPTLHTRFIDILSFNMQCGLKTTVYTNGTRLLDYTLQDIGDASIRVGVVGMYDGDKQLSKIDAPDYPISICFMLNQHNMHKLICAANYTSAKFGSATPFMVSSMKDIAVTGSFFKDTEKTVSVEAYRVITEAFVKDYKGDLKQIEICKRGAYHSDKSSKHCRFSNVFIGGKRITCPFDIALNKTYDGNGFEDRLCNKAKTCLLGKYVFRRI
jgi:organic radical activating enzyme